MKYLIFLIITFNAYAITCNPNETEKVVSKTYYYTLKNKTIDELKNYGYETKNNDFSKNQATYKVYKLASKIKKNAKSAEGHITYITNEIPFKENINNINAIDNIDMMKDIVNNTDKVSLYLEYCVENNATNLDIATVRLNRNNEKVKIDYKDLVY